MKKTLKRRASGFVLYPKEAEKRTIDGTARFRTRCDVIVGPCACGGVHQECDPWVQNTLAENDLEIEPLVLRPDDLGMIFIPRYWVRALARQECCTLHGRCSCGVKHTANERWVRDMLAEHNATIIDCPEASLPTVGDSDQVESGPRGLNGCDCLACRRSHRDNNETLRRGEI